MTYLRLVAVVMFKDLRAELRTKEAVNASLSFALVVLVLFSFAFDPDEETTRAISGGLLWIVFAFAGTLLLNRSFARELPNDCLDALISAPIPGSALLLGKAHGKRFQPLQHHPRIERRQGGPRWPDVAVVV